MAILRRSTGGALALITVGVVAAASVASAQEAPPPIDVPTTPVPQGPAPKTPPAAPKPTAKAPPPPPASTAKKEETPASPKEAKPGSDSEVPKFNNEGVFKVSGTKGSGYTGAKKTAGTVGTTTVGKKVAKVSNAIVAEWPGFRTTPDGGSEVMVEFSKAVVAPSEHKAAGTITYVFKGAHVIKSNNQNPLLTMHFNTPVLSARLVPKKGELHLVIDLRPGVDAIPGSGMRVGADAGGQQFFVKFPAGSYLPKNDDEGEEWTKKTPKTKKTPSSTTPPSTTTKKPTGKGPAE